MPGRPQQFFVLAGGVVSLGAGIYALKTAPPWIYLPCFIASGVLIAMACATFAWGIVKHVAFNLVDQFFRERKDSGPFEEAISRELDQVHEKIRYWIRQEIDATPPPRNDYSMILSIIHEVNHYYRQELLTTDWKQFRNSPREGNKYLSTQGRDFATKLCQIIATAFNFAWSIEVVVTIKLRIDIDDRQCVFTYTRNRPCPERESQTQTYDVDANTAFREALNPPKEGKKIQYYFFSTNLDNHPGYQNQTPNWKQHYKSAIVVPIQLRSQNRRNEFKGFLTVDSQEVGLLRDTDHLYFLAALADQLFNYFTFANFFVTTAAPDGATRLEFPKENLGAEPH